MEYGFKFRLYEKDFTDCFIHYSMYGDGKLKLSLFGAESGSDMIEHFADITLENKKLKLGEDEIVVDDKFKSNFVEQLTKLGILKEKVSDCIIKGFRYPIHKVNFGALYQNCYQYEELQAAA